MLTAKKFKEILAEYSKERPRSFGSYLFFWADLIDWLEEKERSCPSTLAVDMAICPACGEELECSTTKCKHFGQIPPRH